jgi:hypothetical protein
MSFLIQVMLYVLGIVVSYNKSQVCLSQMYLYQSSDPRDGANYEPFGTIQVSFVKVTKAMLHAKYLRSRHSYNET